MALSKDQKQMIMVGILLVVMILVFVNNLKPRKKKPAAPAPSASPAAAVTPAAGQPAVQVKTDGGKSDAGQKERAEMLGWGRDPFLPYEDQPTSSSGFTLKGISIGKGKQGYAFINDEIVKPGDVFMGHEVAAIEKDKVLLQKDGQSFYIVFPAEE